MHHVDTITLHPGGGAADVLLPVRVLCRVGAVHAQAPPSPLQSAPEQGGDAGGCRSTCPPSPAARLQGVDEGGLSKELLQLLFRECCAVQFGMFIELESRLLW